MTGFKGRFRLFYYLSSYHIFLLEMVLLCHFRFLFCLTRDAKCQEWEPPIKEQEHVIPFSFFFEVLSNGFHPTPNYLTSSFYISQYNFRCRRLSILII